ncbi:hypothetical protein DMB42_35475 [Nonomuraea sp. WAC 01424]|nr:hypothetical protein DMB42_35475 [Nonomuraea sp. WAC 01424]
MAVPPIKSITFGIEVSDLDASAKWYDALIGIAAESPDEGILEFRLAQGAHLLLSASESDQGTDGSLNLEVAEVEGPGVRWRRSVWRHRAAGLVEHIPGVLRTSRSRIPTGITLTFLRSSRAVDVRILFTTLPIGSHVRETSCRWYGAAVTAGHEVLLGPPRSSRAPHATMRCPTMQPGTTGSPSRWRS